MCRCLSQKAAIFHSLTHLAIRFGFSWEVVEPAGSSMSLLIKLWERERDQWGVSEVIPAELFEGDGQAHCCRRLSQRHSEGWSCRVRCILESTGSASGAGDTCRRNPQTWYDERMSRSKPLKMRWSDIPGLESQLYTGHQLQNRKYFKSATVAHTQGGPQGSVLGPLLFYLYISIYNPFAYMWNHSTIH